jgi:hypothetical protein
MNRTERLTANYGITEAQAAAIIADTDRLVAQGKILPTDGWNQDRYAAAAESRKPGPKENPTGYQIEKAALEAGDMMSDLENIGRTIPAARSDCRDALIRLAKLALEAAEDLK